MRRPGFRRALRRVREALSLRGDLHLSIAAAAAAEALGTSLPERTGEVDQSDPSESHARRAQDLGRLITLVKMMHTRERFTLARDRANDDTEGGGRADDDDDDDEEEEDDRDQKPPVVVRWVQSPLNIPRIVMEYMRQFRQDEHRPLGEILDRIEITEQRKGWLNVSELRHCQRSEDRAEAGS